MYPLKSWWIEKEQPEYYEEGFVDIEWVDTIGQRHTYHHLKNTSLEFSKFINEFKNFRRIEK